MCFVSSQNVSKWDFFRMGTEKSTPAPLLVARILDGTQKTAPEHLTFVMR